VPPLFQSAGRPIPDGASKDDKSACAERCRTSGWQSPDAGLRSFCRDFVTDNFDVECREMRLYENDVPVADRLEKLFVSAEFHSWKKKRASYCEDRD